MTGTTLFLPPFIQHDKISGVHGRLSQLTESVALGQIVVDFTDVQWAEIYELQKLAVALAAIGRAAESLVLRVPPATSAVREFLIKSGFISFLDSILKAKLSIVDFQQVDDVRIGHTSSVFGNDDGANLGILAMRQIGAQKAVEVVSSAVLTTQELVADFLTYRSRLTYLESGEFAILAVNELAQNVVEHAWTESDRFGGIACISISVTKLGSRSNPKSRYPQRLNYGPPYERAYLESQRGGGYVELCISDFGMGIADTLSRGSNPLMRAESRSEAYFLADAFSPTSTRDPGPHKPGTRGLFHVAQFVREHDGVLHCESAGLAVTFVAPPTAIIGNREINATAVSYESPFSETDVHLCETCRRGTNVRILLPLISRSRSLLRTLKPKVWPRVHGVEDRCTLFSAPEVDSNPSGGFATGILQVRNSSAASVLQARKGPSDRQRELLCFTASKIVRWRKPHMQGFLEETVCACESAVVIMVNVPRDQFFTFLHVARHTSVATPGRFLLLCDQEGQVASIRWGAPSVESFPVGSQIGMIRADASVLTQKAVAPLIDFRAVGGSTVDDLILQITQKGLDIDFSPVIDRLAQGQVAIELSPSERLVGYVELDQALIDSHYLTALANLAVLAIQCLRSPPQSHKSKSGDATTLRSLGIICLSRAAKTVILHRQPAGRQDVWTMRGAEDQQLPTRTWADDFDHFVVVVDVMFRGETVARVVKALTDRLREYRGTKPTRPYGISVLGLLQLPFPTAHSSVRGLLSASSTSGQRIRTSDQSTEIIALHTSTYSPRYEAAEAGELRLTRDPWTNLVFQPRPYEPRDTDDLETRRRLVLLLESAGLLNAIIEGHCEITNEHFDIEFDMDRLLGVPNAFIDAVVDFVIRLLSENAISTVVYPDDSRVHHLVARLLTGIELVEPSIAVSTIRLRRSATGELFCRQDDQIALRSAEKILLLDDAINSGNTFRGAMQLLTQYAPQAELRAFAVVSRQSATQYNLLSGIRSFNAVQFSFTAYVHFPVSFYTSASCPLCRRRDIASAFAATGDTVGLSSEMFRDLVIHLGPLAYYESREARSFHGGRASSDKRPVPLLISSTWYDVGIPGLPAARAAIAYGIAVADDLDARFLLDLLRRLPDDPALRAYSFYAFASRASQSDAIWSNNEIRQLFSDTTNQLGAESTRAPGEDGFTASVTSILFLCDAAWFAPQYQLDWILDVFLQRGLGALTDDRFHSALLLLALRFAERSRDRVRLPEQQPGDDFLRRTINEAKSRETRQRRHPGPARIDSFQRLWRLTQLAEALFGGLSTEPWLDHVPDLLTALSYKAGHRAIVYTSDSDLLESQTLLKSGHGVRGELHFDDLDGFDWDRLLRFLTKNTSELQFLAESVHPLFLRWLRALDFSKTGELPPGIDLNRVGAILVAAASTAAKLLFAIHKLRSAYQRRSRMMVVSALQEVRLAQVDLAAAIYSKVENPNDKPTLRSIIEHFLYPTHEIAFVYSRKSVLERLVIDSGPVILVQGTFFDYADSVINSGYERRSTDKISGGLPWTVVLCTRTLFNLVFENIVISNVMEHVVNRHRTSDRVTVVVDMRGFESVDVHHKIDLSVSVIVNGTPYPFRDNPFGGTLGQHRKRLMLYRGDIVLEASGAGDGITKDRIVIAMHAGHF